MPPRSDLPARADVVVVGAGLAGLAAGRALRRAGLDVQVLDARDRPGGRVHTLRDRFDDGLFAEAGAEFIAPGHATLRRYLHDYCIALRPRPARPRTLHFHGRSSRRYDLSDFGSAAVRDSERIERAAAELACAVEEPRLPWSAVRAEQLDNRSLGSWLDQLQLDPVASAHRAVRTTIDYGVEPDRLSLLMFARDEALIQQSPDRDSECVPGGLDQLPTALARDLADRVHLEAGVRSIEWTSRNVRLSFDDDGPGIQALRLVLALPPPALRRLTFSPMLPAPLHAAIQLLRYCQVVKVHLQFSRRFWHDRGLTSGLISDIPLQSAWDSTHSQPGQRGILTTYTAGQQAQAMRDWSEPRRFGWCLEQLELVFPGCASLFERGASPTWVDQPESGGAYSYFAPGELCRFAPALVQPVGPLHFAGEQTDQWQSTMNGALASGERAAQEIIAALGD